MNTEPRRWLLLEERGDKSFVGPALFGGMSGEEAQKEVIEAAPILAERDSLKAELEQERTNRNEQMNGRLRVMEAQREQMLDGIEALIAALNRVQILHPGRNLTAVMSSGLALLEQAGRTQPKEAEQ